MANLTMQIESRNANGKRVVFKVGDKVVTPNRYIHFRPTATIVKIAKSGNDWVLHLQSPWHNRFTGYPAAAVIHQSDQ